MPPPPSYWPTVLYSFHTRCRGGGFSHWHGIRICACLLGHFFAKFGIAIGEFSSETKEPKLHKLGVFWANYCKKHPIWSKLGAFLSKMVYWWVGNLAKDWYRDSQIFEVRQAHPRTILLKEPPPPGTRWPPVLAVSNAQPFFQILPSGIFFLVICFCTFHLFTFKCSLCGTSCTKWSPFRGFLLQYGPHFVLNDPLFQVL